ncbi:hypothetical protein R3P38DRAFT_2473195, partial [Favolaschia claudopus]
RRVVPSRRTGGKVGNCDVDNMIFEARLERSCLPGDSPFVLTTISALDELASRPAGQSLHNSYFARPEVIEGYRKQVSIWSQFKPPSTREYQRMTFPETLLFMISDDSYLKRHKRYKKLEKGERLRQREKLQHLYYKLNERIKQLRSMDISEFEGAPASMFPSTPSGVHDAAKIISLGKFSGTSYHSEGERRREEMLSTAQTLANRLGAYLTESGRKK